LPWSTDTGCCVKFSLAASGYWKRRAIAAVRQEFARQHHLHPIALRVRLSLDVHGEIDRTHDAIAELLMDELLDGRTVHADDLVPAIDQRVRGYRAGQRSLVRHNLQPGDGLVRQFEQLPQDLGLRLVEGHLTQ